MSDERHTVPSGSDLTDEALRRAVDAAPDGIVVVDEAGTMVFVNPMVEQLFEYGRDELIGRSVDLLLPDAVRGSHAARRARYFDQPLTRPMGSGLDLRGRVFDHFYAADLTGASSVEVGGGHQSLPSSRARSSSALKRA